VDFASDLERIRGVESSTLLDITPCQAGASPSRATPVFHHGLLGSVNHLAVHQVLGGLEVRNFQGAHSLDGQGDGLIGATCRVRLSQALSCSPQNAENLRPIESLTFTVITEAHMLVPRLHLSADASHNFYHTATIVHTE
jgi:hypothetical protein